MANRYRWQILAERRREEAREAVIFGFFLPLAIVIFSIIWGIYA